jgi:acid-sensing ion channel, other
LSKLGGYGYASQIQVLFKSAEFFPLILQQKLTTLDFVSLCGGSLGLFLGISAVSVIELVYFFTIRLFFKMKSRNKVQIFTRTEKKERKKTNYFVKVMKSSSIHGCNHAVCRDFHWTEKLE